MAWDNLLITHLFNQRFVAPTWNICTQDKWEIIQESLNDTTPVVVPKIVIIVVHPRLDFLWQFHMSLWLKGENKDKITSRNDRLKSKILLQTI